MQRPELAGVDAFSVSMTGRNMAKREKKLSVVPTGQMVLQYVRPFFQARMTTTTSVTTATRKVGRPGAVRGEQGDERLHAGDEGDDEEHPDAVAQPLHFGAVGIRKALFRLPVPGDMEMGPIQRS